MSGPTLRQKVLVTNPQGLHIRPATKFAECAQKFDCEVFVLKEEQRVNGRNPLELFLLVALPGTELTIEVSGPDAEKALPLLVEVINTPCNDES